MITELQVIERYGKRIAKIKQNNEDTKHLFIYEYNKHYFYFTKYKGLLIGTEGTLIEGSKHPIEI